MDRAYAAGARDADGTDLVGLTETGADWRWATVKIRFRAGSCSCFSLGPLSGNHDGLNGLGGPQ